MTKKDAAKIRLAEVILALKKEKEVNNYLHDYYHLKWRNNDRDFVRNN